MLHGFVQVLGNIYLFLEGPCGQIGPMVCDACAGDIDDRSVGVEL